MNNKNINYLIIMRIWAAVILVVCCYWLFSDLEIDFSKYSLMYLPWIYFYYTDLYLTKKLAILLVPLLMNMALWIPCYRSYLFIRVVLYTERIIARCWAVVFLGMLWGILFAHGSILDVLLINVIFIAFNELMLTEVKKEKFKEKFSTTLNLKTEKEITLLTRKLAVVFYITIFLLLSGENLLQKNNPPDYSPIETINSITIVDKNNKNQEILYQTIWKKKLSRDEKMLLVKIPSYKEEGNNKNLFVVDFASMETINILPSSNSTTKNFNNNDYEFTPDNKYVIVGNRVLDNPKIKFTVLDIATGKVDLRFHDPQGLLENLPQDIEEVPLIRFNPSGNYFVVISRVKYPNYRLEFWNYNQGKLMYVENIKGYMDLTWLSEGKCIIFYEQYDTNTKKYIRILEQREILTDEAVLTISKEKISSDIEGVSFPLQEKYIESDVKGKYLSIFNWGKNIVQIWEVDSEQKIFSLDRDNQMIDTWFHPDGKTLLVFERLKNKIGRITFWNIATGKKQRSVFIPPIITLNHRLLINNGSKVISFDDSINIVSLEGILVEMQ